MRFFNFHFTAGSSLLLVLFLFISLNAVAVTKFNFKIAPGTLAETSVAFIWDKQYLQNKPIYEVYLNNKIYGSLVKTNFIVEDLISNTWYNAKIVIKGDKNHKSSTLNSIRFKTPSKGRIFNILDYGAKNDATFNNTEAIQSAISACTPNGTVYIPKGIFVSGALHLKSNMTLYIEEGGVLKGSKLIEDYLPMILNRFEGWEMKTYASLLNAGTLNRDGSYNVKNLRITGKGAIIGGGIKLADNMIKAGGIRSRGRLICLINCQNISISNLTISEPPSWTIHYIYSDNITCHDLKITTYRIVNGDGIDPDSSTNCYIFNCTFDTGDDCIAIKSGKNPEGFFIGKPTKNVQITNCDFIRGHGISIGSEISGGVSDVLVQDCKAGKLLYGLQIKATKDRGGYVKNVTVADCQLLRITIYSAVNYNNDGEPAPEIPVFEDFVFRNIDLSLSSDLNSVININGFKDLDHRLKNVVFQNILLPEKSKIIANDAENIQFIDVKSASGLKPEYVISNGKNIVY